MVERMIRALQADIQLYEEVEHNTALTQEAYQIVGTASCQPAKRLLPPAASLPSAGTTSY